MVTDENGNVGIGTTNPTAKLYIAGGGRNGLKIDDSFIPVLNWTSTGKVGIGTISPSQLLQVNNGSTIRFQVAPLAGVWVNNEVNGGKSTPT